MRDSGRHQMSNQISLDQVLAASKAAQEAHANHWDLKMSSTDLGAVNDAMEVSVKARGIAKRLGQAYAEQEGISMQDLVGKLNAAAS